MRQVSRFLLCCLLLLLSPAEAADANYDNYDQGGGYDQEYSQDNLYHDYAKKQQEKETGAGGGWTKAIVGASLGWIVGGKIHSGRKEKKLNAKHKEEQKALYSQYYNDVYALQQQNAELAQALEGMGVRVKK